MRKFLIVLLILLGILVVAAWAIPTFFKDDIFKLVQEQLDEKLEAKVSLNPDEFSLNMFSNFPNLTAQIGDLQIIGKDNFEGDTLANIETIAAEVNLKSILFGDAIQVAGVSLVKPNLHIKVLADGQANYMIYKGDSTATEEEESKEESSFALSIDHWEIQEGNIIYDDKTLPLTLTINGLNHTGSGDITAEDYDLATNTTINALSVIYDGIGYMNKTKLDASITLAINAPSSTYAFKESTIQLNEFGIDVNGAVKMPSDDIDLDISFKSHEGDFKSLISLIPAVFLEGFEQLEAKGELAFDGNVKGIYNDTSMPGFLLNLGVKDGYFKYPDLPSAIQNIQINGKVDNSSGNLDNLLVELSQFSMQLGNNPISGNLKMKGLEEYDIHAQLEGKVDLAEITQIYPIDSVEMKGIYKIHLVADGIYSDKKQLIPTIDAAMTLTDGYINALAAPYPMENIHIEASAKNETGNMKDFRLGIEDASMVMDGKPLTAKGHVYDLEAVNYDFDLTGGVDLAAITNIYPIDGTTLKGQIDAVIHTKGSMAAIDAEKYDQLPTSGSITVTNLDYKSTDLPQGLTIKDAKATFTPKDIVLSQYTGTLGQSDMKLTGKISNYLAYVLKDDPLKGNLTLNSQTFNVNEWMVDESGEPIEEVSTGSGGSGGSESAEEYGVVELPKNIDFSFDATIKRVLYENFVLNDLTGNIRLYQGVASLNNVSFGMYGGRIATNGTYDPTDSKNPTFDFGLGIQKLPIVEAYQNYASVQQLAPIAKFFAGDFGSDLKVSGKLGQDLMPIYSSLNGSGDVKVTEAAMQKLPIMQKIASFTGMQRLGENRSLKDINLKTEIKDGKVNVAPFDINIAGYEANISGTAGLDGSMDYAMKIDLPLKELKFDWAAQYQQFTGAETIPLNLNIGGTIDKPTVGLDDSQKQAIQAQLKQALKDKKDAAVDSLKNTGKGLIKDALGGLIKPDSTKTDSSKSAKPSVKDLFPLKKKSGN